MICPHCKRPWQKETDRQLEAYRLVCLEGLCQEQVARMMGILQCNVSRLLKRLFIKYPVAWEGKLREK